MATSVANLHAELTLNDRASPGLVRASRNTQKLGADLRSAGQSMATFASSLASLLVTTGALDSKTGQWATALLAVSGAFISIIPALTTINRLMRTNAAILAFVRVLTNPVIGTATLAVAGAAALGTGAFLASRAVNRETEQRERFRQPRTVTVNNDLRGATIRGEDDLNELSRRVSRSVPPRL